MKVDIERLLRLAADYHNFCDGEPAYGEAGGDPDELSVDELDFVAAAAGIPPEEALQGTDGNWIG